MPDIRFFIAFPFLPSLLSVATPFQGDCPALCSGHSAAGGPSCVTAGGEARVRCARAHAAARSGGLHAGAQRAVLPVLPGLGGPRLLERACPNGCSARGACVNGTCVCEQGFSDTDCAQQTPSRLLGPRVLRQRRRDMRLRRGLRRHRLRAAALPWRLQRTRRMPPGRRVRVRRGLGGAELRRAHVRRRLRRPRRVRQQHVRLQQVEQRRRVSDCPNLCSHHGRCVHSLEVVRATSGAKARRGAPLSPRAPPSRQRRQVAACATRAGRR